ncbi:MAG: TetR/AcrR family transcriptional regulator [Rhodospirillales bacterium]|nr:TetR/AcrR family transcriptional regulator [Rhodospirillales bacterium]
MLLFWDRGYEGTSFDDLIAAMRISPSSFYNSFTSKERLYQEAIEAFQAQAAEGFLGDLASGPDTKSAFARVLERAAREFTAPDHPRGCMISLACTHGPPALDGLHERLAGYRHAAQSAMAARIRQGIAAGDVAPATDAEALAGYYDALLRGMAVAARDGANEARLRETAAIAMRAFPAAARAGNPFPPP